MGKASGANRNRRISNDSNIKGVIRRIQADTEATREPINGPPNFSSQSPLRTAGGIMTGHIGFMSDAFAINSGNLDLTVNAAAAITAAPPDVFVDTESGTTDTLDTIDTGGIEFTGMRLLLRGVTGNTITITHGTANSGDLKGINCIGDIDYQLKGDDAIQLQWDIVDGKWSMIAGGGGSSGGFIFDENDLGTINGGNNIDWALSPFHRCIADGDITFTMTNLPPAGKYETIVLEIKQDGTGLHDIVFADSFLNSHLPVINKVANGVTSLAFYTYDDGSDRILGFNTIPAIPLAFALSDETSALASTSTTVPIGSFRMPGAMILTEVRSNLFQASSSGLVTLDIKESGTTILSTALSIDANEETSTTASTPAVISDTVLADDAKITVFLTARGTNATGLKLSLIGYQA